MKTVAGYEYYILFVLSECKCVSSSDLEEDSVHLTFTYRRLPFPLVSLSPEVIHVCESHAQKTKLRQALSFQINHSHKTL